MCLIRVENVLSHFRHSQHPNKCTNEKVFEILKHVLFWLRWSFCIPYLYTCNSNNVILSMVECVYVLLCKLEPTQLHNIYMSMYMLFFSKICYLLNVDAFNLTKFDANRQSYEYIPWNTTPITRNIVRSITIGHINAPNLELMKS